MLKYRAKIVGFKRSKSKEGFYHPIFEYTDAYREKRQYVRNTSMERTPFTAKKKYIICKQTGLNRIKTYEQTERVLPPFIFFCLMSIIARIVAMINSNAGMWATIFISLCVIGYHTINVEKTTSLRKRKRRIEPIEGKIVGYQKLRRQGEGGSVIYESHPVIEYIYKGKTYQHISKMQRHDEKNDGQTGYNIYVDCKRRKVFDELETNATVDLALLLSICPQYFFLRSFVDNRVDERERAIEQSQNAKIERKDREKKREQEHKVHGVVSPIRRAC